MICGEQFDYLYELERHLLYHEWVCEFECRLCRRHFNDRIRLHEHRRHIHNSKLNPKPIRILDRLGDAICRDIPYVPSPFVVTELVNRNSRPAVAKRRTTGQLTQARYIRTRNVVMRGLRKPAVHPWDRCVDIEWKSSEWRHGRLLANDIKCSVWTDDFEDISHDDLMDCATVDVWWRRPSIENASELIQDLETVPKEKSVDSPEEYLPSECARYEDGIDANCTISECPELFSHPLVNCSEDHDSDKNFDAKLPKHRSKLRRLHKWRLIALPFLEPGPSLPSFETVLSELSQ